MAKILTWIMVNGASILGIAQAVIKGVKELLTAVVNILSIFMPVEAAENVVMAVRNFVNILDGWIEKLKVLLIPKV